MTQHNEPYPWYSNDNEYIWQQIRLLLTLPDMRNECILDYTSLTDYFLTIEALEGPNAWNFFLEHYGVLEKRFKCRIVGYSSWEYVFYNLLFALGSKAKQQTNDGKVNWKWYSRSNFELFKNNACQVRNSLHSCSYSPLTQSCAHRSFPVRALNKNIIDALDKGDIACVMLEIDLSKNQETKLKNIRHYMLNREMFEQLCELQKLYNFPKEDIPPAEYYLWDHLNKTEFQNQLLKASHNEKAVMLWDKSNPLVRFFDFSQKLCNLALDTLAYHDLLTPGILNSVLEHKGNAFVLKISNIEMFQYAEKLEKIVETLPPEYKDSAQKNLEKYVKQSYFQLARVLRQFGRLD